MLEFLTFRGATVFEVESITIHAGCIEHLLQVLDQALCVVVPSLIPALAGVSRYDEHAISTFREGTHYHIG